MKSALRIKNTPKCNFTDLIMELNLYVLGHRMMKNMGPRAHFMHKDTAILQPPTLGHSYVVYSSKTRISPAPISIPWVIFTTSITVYILLILAEIYLPLN